MATATERVPVLVTASEKGQIAKMAKAAGLSMGEFLRRAAASFRPSKDDTVDRMAATMITQQQQIESSTERVIRPETALQPGPARSSATRPAGRTSSKA